jgi:hypothetical protein
MEGSGPSMSAKHPLQCRCGTLKGEVALSGAANHVICYCRDCQAFAFFLGREGDVLDTRGGSDVVQTLPKNVTFTQGQQALACMRLTPTGLVRWYASCCNTPIGNTLDGPKISFVGLVHSCLESAGRPLEEVFGPVRAWLHGGSARGEPKPKMAGNAAIGAWFFVKVVWARFNGDYKITPFFNPGTTTLAVTPRVLGSEERSKLMDAVDAARA